MKREQYIKILQKQTGVGRRNNERSIMVEYILHFLFCGVRGRVFDLFLLSDTTQGMTASTTRATLLPGENKQTKTFSLPFPSLVVKHTKGIHKRKKEYKNIHKKNKAPRFNEYIKLKYSFASKVKVDFHMQKNGAKEKKERKKSKRKKIK